MSVRSCRVTIQDVEGVAHTVEVTAESLYEAVAQGLAALRRSRVDRRAATTKHGESLSGRCSRRASSEAGGLYAVAGETRCKVTGGNWFNVSERDPY